ncbi:MAG: hypothetical protein JWO36_2995 [Myxococcales bacterium]|nr:hypothetical protein [Myxococcales bacterium]
MAWVARTAEQYVLTGGESAIEDALWKLDQVLGAYARVRKGSGVFGLTIPDDILAEVATPCEVLIEQAIDDSRQAMVQQFGDAGSEMFYRRARYFGIKLDGDPGPAAVRVKSDTDVRHATQRLIKRLRDGKRVTEYWLATAYDPYDIPPEEVVGCTIRLPRPDLDVVVNGLVDRGVHLPDALVSLYRECNGISVGWVSQGTDGPRLAELSAEDALLRPFEDIVGYLDEHSPDELLIGLRGGGWYMNRITGDVYDGDNIHGRPSLLAHIDELAETYGLYQRLEPSNS